MYVYLQLMYRQWCTSDNVDHTDGEQFIEQVHTMTAYDKDVLRRYLIRQHWFTSNVNKDLC